MKFTIVVFILSLFVIQKVLSQTNNDKTQCVKSETIVNGTQVPCSGQKVFSEDFDGTTLDASQWNTSSKYYLKDGKLHLPIDSSSRSDPVLAVISKFSFLYGRIDIRARIALGTAIPVDFSFGFGKNFPDSKIYFGNVSNSNTETNYYELTWWLHHEFHIYSITWHRSAYEYKCDGVRALKTRRPATVSNEERKISLEISKDFSGLPLNSEMVIDYIRVYSTDKDDIITACEATVTEVWPPSNKPICEGDVIFEDFFDNVDGRKWMHEIQGPRTNRDEEFVLYDTKAFAQDKFLHIKPTLWTDYQPDLNIFNSFLNLSERCTSGHDTSKECVMRALGQFIMPPIVSPRLTTRNSFSFKYGRIEFNAKIPKGDWIVPLLILEPREENYGTSGYESGQIRVAMARGNEYLESPDGKKIGGQTLFGGPVLTNDARWRDHFMVNRTQFDHFGDDMHLYSMVWSPDKMEFFVDAESYGVIDQNFKETLFNKKWKDGGAKAPFDTLFYITLGISVGGFGDFVDGVRTQFYNKPWINYDPKARLHFWLAQDKWYSSWDVPELTIDYIRVMAL